MFKKSIECIERQNIKQNDLKNVKQRKKNQMTFRKTHEMSHNSKYFHVFEAILISQFETFFT